MARKRGSRKSQVGSGSESEEVGIYNVERIVAKKIDSKGKVFYLIKWEGYPSSQNTWESEENVFSEALIKDFEDREKSKFSSQNDDEFTPSKSPIKAKTPISPSRSPLKNQKPEVISIKTVTRDSDTGDLCVHCNMSDNRISIIPTSVANIEFPQIMIKFYESRIKFKDSSSKST